MAGRGKRGAALAGGAKVAAAILPPSPKRSDKHCPTPSRHAISVRNMSVDSHRVLLSAGHHNFAYGPPIRTQSEKWPF